MPPAHAHAHALGLRPNHAHKRLHTKLKCGDSHNLNVLNNNESTTQASCKRSDTESSTLTSRITSEEESNSKDGSEGVGEPEKDDKKVSFLRNQVIFKYISVGRWL